ncbi:ABC transporter ATP-binding protein [Aminipila luticellarii]|uniref:ABC transporter ATP-binding protein n=1 Tax=Aminipila luticellarii TaxID=2507160 RepID=A0A410PVF8_9FIRM|nr:ABC transporter ATP-binding protein [Aminipila luticellarii]QAT42931.1 ABC transporter ATP-binding protein [Aminipila luticellarii]
MIQFFRNKFALSEKGAKDLMKAAVACTLTDLSFMLPVGLLYLVLKALTVKYTGGSDEVLPVYVYVAVSVLLLAIIWIFQRIQYNATFLASYEESADQRISIAEKLRKIPLSFFGKKDLSDLTTTIMADCAGMETAFSHFIPELLGAVFSLIFISIGLFLCGWELALSLLWVIPVAFAVTMAGKKQQDKMNKLYEESKLERADSIQECLEMVREIKANNQSESYLVKMDVLLQESEKINIKTELVTAIFVVSSQMLLRVGVATLVLVGAKQIASGKVDFLTFLLFLIGASRVFDPLAIALQNLAAIFSTEVKIDRMKEINNQKIQKGEDPADFKSYDIQFEQVCFSYDAQEKDRKNKVLEGISFIARQGEVTALVGPSGGGKSTVSKLAARFWDIQSGRITVGGNDIAQIEPEELLKNYAIVFQDVVLFNNTVLENIRLGRRGATDQEVMQAAKLAMCDEFVGKMPQGYHTIIGENGSTLSGGERQRISIARALLKNAPIILLDEATASLDVENESKVQQAISRLVQNKTVLVIAHRMRTIAGADHIVVLSEGKIAEEGTHEELLNQGGLYQRLWSLQTKSAEWTV